MLVDDVLPAGMLPDGQLAALDHDHDQRVGQEPHDAGLLDPAHLLDMAAQVVQVEAHQGLVLVDARGLGDVGLGQGRGALDLDMANAEAGRREPVVDGAAEGRNQPLAAVTGGQRRAERQRQDQEGAGQRQPGGKAVRLARGSGGLPPGSGRGARRPRGRLDRRFRLYSRAPPHRRRHTHPP